MKVGDGPLPLIISSPNALRRGDVIPEEVEELVEAYVDAIRDIVASAPKRTSARIDAPAQEGVFA